jgi:O-antigen/teichoic acid export membrane protein
MVGAKMADGYASDSALTVSRGASYLTLQTIVTSVAQVLSFAILARIVTPGEVGILAILSLVTGLCQAINGAAFQQASTKYLGEFTGTRNELASGVFYQTLRVSFVISVPIAAFIFFGSGLLARDLVGTVGQAGLFRVLAVDVLAYCGVLPVTIGAVLGMKRFKAAATIGAAGAILRQCLIILLILFLKDFIGLVYAWLFSDFAMLAAYGLYVVRVLGMPKSLFPLRELFNFTWPLSIGNIVSFAYGSFDRAILIVFVPLASLGVYNAASTAFAALVAITVAFNNALLPVFSGISGRGGLEGCRKAVQVSSRYASLIVVPLTFGLLATARPALTLFVGKAYVGGAEPLIIFCLASAVTAFGLGFGPMMVALSETRASMWITVVSVVLALGSAYALLPFLGIIGAAIARGLATVASLGLTIVVLRRRRVMSIDVDMAWKSLVAGGVMAGVLIAFQMVVYSILLLPLYVVLGAIVYMILLRLLKAVRKHDIDLIERYLGPRLGFLARLFSVILVA